MRGGGRRRGRSEEVGGRFLRQGGVPSSGSWGMAMPGSVCSVAGSCSHSKCLPCPQPPQATAAPFTFTPSPSWSALHCRGMRFPSSQFLTDVPWYSPAVQPQAVICGLTIGTCAASLSPAQASSPTTVFSLVAKSR